MKFERAGDARQVLEHLTDGAAHAVLVTGDPGSGRSAVLDLVARLSPWTTRRVSVGPLEAVWPHSGVLALLAAVPHPRSRALARQITTQQQADPFRIAMAVHDLLHDIECPPTLFLVEAVDLMEPASREVLGSVLGRLADTELRFVLSGCDTTAMAPFAGLPTHMLRPLASEAITAMALRRHDGALSPAVALLAARAAQGNPGLAVELLAGLTGDQLGGEAPLLLPLRLPAAHQQIAEAALAELGDDALALLRTVALAPAVSARILASLDPESASLITDLLSKELLVRDRAGIRVARTTLRSAVFWRMSAAQRQERYRDMLAACPPDEPERAWYDYAVNDSPSSALDLGRLMQRAAAAELPDVAAEYAERLLAGTGGPSSHTHILGELSYAFFTSTEFRLAERYLHFAGAHAPEPADELVQVRVHLGIEYMRNQRILRGVAADALQRLTDDCPEQAVELMVVLAFYHLERWEPAEARSALEQARAVARRSSPRIQDMVTTYEELLEAFETGRPPAPGLAESGQATPTLVIAKARALSHGEQYAEAGYMYDLLLNGRMCHDRLWVETADVFAVDSHVRSSNMRAALASARRASGENHRSEAHLGYRLFLEAWYRDESGDVAGAQEARGLLRGALTNSDSLSVTCRQDVQMAEYALHTGDPGTALRLVRRVEDATSHLSNPQITRAAPAMVEALVELDDRPGALRALAAFEVAHHRVPSRWAEHPLSRCRALVTEGEASLPLFEQALEAPTTDPYEVGRTLSVYASRLARLGHDDQAAATGEICANHFRELGLPRWASAVQERFATGRPGAPPGPDLGEEERRLVAMVTEGLTNRQIAQQLFVSTRTVEARLTVLYRRLGVTSRTELATREQSWAAPGDPHDHWGQPI